MVAKNQPFAVFDIDGTLIRWQLYHAVVHELAKEGSLGQHAPHDLRTLRMAWKRREEPLAWKAYEHRVVELYESALHALAPATFDQAVNKVLDEYKDQAYVYTRELIKELKQKGYFLLIISGSHHEMIEQLARHYGFDDWIGSQYARSGQTFNGDKYIPSLQKGKQLETFVKHHGLTYTDSFAVGDSKSDIPMLEMVEHPVAFNPDQVLFDHAKQAGWDIVIERKNVVYKLEKRDGHYVLA